jgi:hypothetical protein
MIEYTFALAAVANTYGDNGNVWSTWCKSRGRAGVKG